MCVCFFFLSFFFLGGGVGSYKWGYRQDSYTYYPILSDFNPPLLTTHELPSTLSYRALVIACTVLGAP